MKRLDRWANKVGLFLCLGLWILAGCSSSSSSSGNNSDQPLNPAISAQLQKVMDTVIAEYRIPGAVMGVRLADGATWFGSSGTASLSTHIDMTTNLIGKIGSVSKTFEATVVLQLTEARNGSILNLNQTLGQWMPAIRALPDVPDNWQVPANWEALTLRQLLNHTTGIIEYNYDPDFRDNYYLPAVPHVWAPYQLVDISAKYPLYFPPGTAWLYSNTGYILLGMIVEAATGVSIESQVQQRVIGPLWLYNTTFPVSPQFPEPHAQGYHDQNNNGFLESFENVTALDPSYSWAAGAIVMDIHDFLNYSIFLARGDLLEPQTQVQRTTWFPPASPPLTGYGLGLSNEQGYIGHIGDILGYQAIITYRDGNAIAVMVNGEPPDQVSGNLTFNSVAHEIFKRSLPILSLPPITSDTAASQLSTGVKNTATSQVADQTIAPSSQTIAPLLKQLTPAYGRF